MITVFDDARLDVTRSSLADGPKTAAGGNGSLTVMPTVAGISGRCTAFEGIGTALFPPDHRDRALHCSWNYTR